MGMALVPTIPPSKQVLSPPEAEMSASSCICSDVLIEIRSVKAVPSYPGFILSLTLNLIFFPAVTLTEYSICFSLLGPSRSLAMSDVMKDNLQEGGFVEIRFGVDVYVVWGLY